MASFDFNRLQMGMLIVSLKQAIPYTTWNRKDYQDLLDHIEEKLSQET
jgi:hypothetical protein